MLLESIAANLVNKFCSRFVKDFKKENLTISLTGDICLTQFELNTNEIKELQLPVELKSFTVGRLRVNVPFTSLTTQSAQVELSDVNVLLGTPRDPKWDLDSLYVAEQTKIYLMEMLLEYMTPTLERSNGTKKSQVKHHVNKPPSGGSEMSPSLVSLIQNCEIKIERIHIRFEDGLSGLDLEQPTKYALGVTLGCLHVHPATSVITVSDVQEKSMSITQLSIYFKEDIIIEDLSPEERAKAFRAPFDGVGTGAIPLLEPLSLNVVCQITLKPSVRLSLQCNVPSLQLNIAKAHYQYLDCFLKHVDRFDRYSLYRRFRPPTSDKFTKRNWREWWRYAIVAVMMDLNDPVRRKPTWRSTLNLVLVGLQYTAIRRTVKPYLIRQALDTDHHFLQFREDFKGNTCHSQAPFDRSMMLAAETIPKHVTHFGDGIFAGVYGLYRCFPKHDTCAIVDNGVRQAEPVVENEEAKRLWHRQLCIDATFRPIVVAKLRVLANQQLVHKEHMQAIVNKSHNRKKGTLTITLMDIQGIPKSMLLFCKVKIGHKGSAYTGDHIRCDVAQNVEKHSKLAAEVSETFEFRLEGTPNEDYIHINFFDQWPMFNQFVGKFRLPLAGITAEKCSDQTCMIESAEKNSKDIQLHVLTVFTSDGSPNGKGTFQNSTAMMESMYPDAFKQKPPTLFSWYQDPTKFKLHTISGTILVDQLNIAFVFPAPTLNSKCVMNTLLIQLKGIKYLLHFVPQHLKYSIGIERLDMFHGNEQARTHFFQAPRDTTRDVPFFEFDQEVQAKQPVQMNIHTEPVAIILDIPVLFRHVMFVKEKIPELTAFGSLFGAPVYQAMMQYSDTDNEMIATKVKETKPPELMEVKSTETTTSPRFLTNFSWGAVQSPKTSQREANVKHVSCPPTADRSEEFITNIDLGAMYITLAGALVEEDSSLEGRSSETERVMEVMIPGTKLIIQGGNERPTEVKTNSSTLVTMDRDMQWVFDQIDKINKNLKYQVKADSVPFYERNISSRSKVQRFEQEVHELERQLAGFRGLIRQVVDTPEKYQIKPEDCNSLRFMVRDLKPKVIDASAETLLNANISITLLLLRQGITVIKHNLRQGDPSWRILWHQENAICIAKPNDRKHGRVIPITNILGIATDLMTPALQRSGMGKEISKYLAIQLADSPKPISLEFQTEEIRSRVASALRSLLTK